VPHSGPWLGFVALGCAAIAAAILIGYLIRRPVLDLRAKLALFLGLGVFPALAAAASTVAGMERTTDREFCGSCHVMDAHFQDAIDPKRQSLAARHSRNPLFGEHSCYVCHADYGMYGYAMTKTGGMRHVYEYYLGGYRSLSLDQALKVIHLRKPYDNLNCRQCHTTTLKGWRSVPDHEALKSELFSNKVSCASAGCHGFAHPFDKGEKQTLASREAVAAARSSASVAPLPAASGIPAPRTP
jgi:nitrate/TMAO reductase-like tetraheme cytochrome c subunit